MSQRQASKYEIERPSEASPDEVAFLRVMLRDPEEALRWAGGVAKNKELRSMGMMVCSCLRLKQEASDGFAELDRARLSFLAEGMREPASRWLQEGARGYGALARAVSSFHDTGVSEPDGVWLCEAAIQDPGFAAWAGAQESSEAKERLDQISIRPGALPEFQALFCESLSPKEARAALRFHMDRGTRGLARSTSKALALRAMEDPAIKSELAIQALYQDLGRMTDQAGAGLIEALSEASFAKEPGPAKCFGLQRPWVIVGMAWEALAREEFETGVAWAGWAAKLGAADRRAPGYRHTAGGGRKKTARRASVTHSKAYHQGPWIAGEGLCGVALALQSEWALKELMKLGWSLPKKAIAQRMARELRDYARGSNGSSAGAYLKWEGDLRDTERPPLATAGDALFALWERVSLERAQAPSAERPEAKKRLSL